MFSSSQGSIRSSVKPSYVPKTMSNLFEGLSKVDSLSDRFFVLNDYLEKYKEELSKVNSLKLDLPQCMLLLMDAVKTLEEEVENVWNEMKSQLNEKPTEFSPVHGRGDLIRDGESYLREKDVCNFGEDRGVCRLDRGEMKDNSTVDAIGIQLCKTRNRGHATLNLNRSPAVTESNSVECIKPGSLRVKTNHQQRDFQFKSIPKSSSRNPRRSWTAELHNRFLEALEHLGGPEVATPRKIREAMKMDDLTNGQVKSHLQVMEVDLILKTNRRLKEHVNLRHFILHSHVAGIKIPDSAIDKLVAGRQSNPDLTCFFLGKSRSYDR